ncbi:MAG TPA: hypothetical protein VMF89_32025, partial [Polyangiales bacterium]|nr:hypothetical protein [Polyangiales bacterium]
TLPTPLRLLRTARLLAEALPRLPPRPACAVSVPAPLAALTGALSDARARGETFDAAWTTSVDRALNSAEDDEERREWRTVFNAVRDEFEACYDRSPTRTSTLIASIIDNR